MNIALPVQPLPPSPHLDQTVAGLTASCGSLWDSGSDTLPEGIRTHSRTEQERRDTEAREMVSQCTAQHPTHREAASRIIALVARMDAETPADEEARRALLQCMAGAGEAFTEEAGKFDSSLSADGMAQALRNLWVMNSIQVLCGLPVALTRSCFAYSLLYPYTDNLLDDPQTSEADKHAFARRLAARLAGERTEEPGGHREHCVWNLIHEIEREWPRRRYPLVYAGLLAIHKAQTESLLLQRAGSVLPEERVLHLTFAKGGTSVLAHGFLVRGTLTDQDCRWIFGFGTVLQLIDDLQDLFEDRARGHHTVFSGCTSPHLLSTKISRLLGYSYQMAALFPRPIEPRQRVLLRLIRGSALMLVCEAAASLTSVLPPPYIAMLEHRSPLTFDCLQALRNRAGDLLTSKSLDMFRTASSTVTIPRRMRYAS